MRAAMEGHGQVSGTKSKSFTEGSGGAKGVTEGPACVLTHGGRARALLASPRHSKSGFSVNLYRQDPSYCSLSFSP